MDFQEEELIEQGVFRAFGPLTVSWIQTSDFHGWQSVGVR